MPFRMEDYDGMARHTSQEAANRLMRLACRVLVVADLATVIISFSITTNPRAVIAQTLPLCGGNQIDHPAPRTCTPEPFRGTA
jgi:hypothetical protein